MTTINYQLSSRQCMRWTVGLNSGAICEQKFPEAVNVIEPVQHQGNPSVGRISVSCLASVSMPCSFRSFQSQSIGRKLLLRHFHCLLTSFWPLQLNAILRERDFLLICSLMRTQVFSVRRLTMECHFLLFSLTVQETSCILF